MDSDSDESYIQEHDPEEIFYDLLGGVLTVKAFRKIRNQVNLKSLTEFIEYTDEQNPELLVDFLFGADDIDEKAAQEFIKHIKCQDIVFSNNITERFMCRSAVDILFNICGDNLPENIVSALYLPYYTYDENYQYFIRKFKKSWKIKLMEEENRADLTLILLNEDNKFLQYDNPYVFLFLRGYTSEIDPVVDRFIDLFEELKELFNVMDRFYLVDSNNRTVQTALEIAYLNLELREREICKELEKMIKDIPELEEILLGSNDPEGSEISYGSPNGYYESP